MDEFHQAMLERMMRVEEAIERAMRGQADHEDWLIIKYECGLGLKPVEAALKQIKENHVNRTSH